MDDSPEPDKFVNVGYSAENLAFSLRAPVSDFTLVENTSFRSNVPSLHPIKAGTQCKIDVYINMY